MTGGTYDCAAAHASTPDLSMYRSTTHRPISSWLNGAVSTTSGVAHVTYHRSDADDAEALQGGF